MKFIWMRLFFACVLFSCLFIIYAPLTFQIPSFDYFKEVINRHLNDSSLRPWNGLFPKTNNSDDEIDEQALFSQCVLTQFDPDGWTKEVMREAQVDWDPLKKCNADWKPYTILGENGTVWMDSSNEEYEQIKCWARTIYHNDDFKMKTGNWYLLSGKATSFPFDSDFVHTNCQLKNDSSTIEDFVHLQMWNTTDDRGSALPPIELTPSGEIAVIDAEPSVYIFVLDSVANSQAWRSLPLTIALMEREFEAVNLQHLNKVGENSHPNGLAFLLGQLETPIDRGLFGMENVEPDWNKNYACHRYLDDDHFILSDYTKKGYKTLFAEDWASGVFNYPDCWGFKNKPVTHYMKPFQLYYEQNLNRSLKFMGRDQCFEYHTFLLNYFKKFMAAYPKSPKAALVWASEIAHNYNDGLFHVDTQLFNFLRNFREQLDKSYLFFMGDHGIRWGKVRDTWLGEREINNPMMYVSVPRHLRNRINPILKDNSLKLLTSFDIHASLVDILNDPQLTSTHGPQDLRGNSFLRPLPPGERSCRTLPIPPQYCLCEWNRTLSKNNETKEQIGVGVVDLLNGIIEDNNISRLCEEYTLNEVETLMRFDRTNGIHEVLFTTKECEAEFKTIIRVHEDAYKNITVSLVASDITRYNSYGRTADCLNNNGFAHLRPLCCCRDRQKPSTVKP